MRSAARCLTRRSAVRIQPGPLAHRDGINLKGLVTWAFEFEDQPYFAGCRELATNGLDKPVLNTFRMLGLLGGEQIEAVSSAALKTDQILSDGVRSAPDVRVIATRTQHGVE